MNAAQVEELLYQALETELGGVQVYEMAISCAVNDDLHKEWEKYGAETKTHVQVVEQVFEQLGLDTSTETPGRQSCVTRQSRCSRRWRWRRRPVTLLAPNSLLPNVW